MKTLYTGGPILTMEQPFYAEALLVENGRIAAVGARADLEALAGRCRRVDLHGAALMPAFVDAHSHFTQVALSFLQLSVNGVSDEGALVEAIRDYIRREQIRPGEWVQVRDYDNNLLPGAQHPARAALDAAAPCNPLFVQHKSGHIGLFNSRALERLGVTEDTPDPEGGRFVRDASGRLTGCAEENALFAVQRKILLPGPKSLMQAYTKAQELYASHGIATVQEGMLDARMLPLYAMLERSELLQLDVVAYPDAAAFPKVKEQFPQAFGRYHHHIRIGGLKMFLDGSPQSRTAWMLAPYAGETEYRGYGTLSDDAVTANFLLAAGEHTQILAHCNGDAAAQQYLDCLEQAEKQAPVLAELRPVMIHGQLLQPDQMPRLKELGVILSFFVAHVYHWGDVHIRNFGMERASQISAAASALRCGLRFTFHQDSPVIPPDMLETIWCAVERRTQAGATLGEAERLPVEEALRAVTVNAAYQYFEEGEKGTLAVGKRADLVVLDRNPLVTPSAELRNIRVLQTIKDGRTIYKQ